MGHIRLGRLPKRGWQRVVQALESPEGSAGSVFLETVNAARRLFWDENAGRVGMLAREPGLLHSFWYLTQIVFPSRRDAFWEHLRQAGVSVPRGESMTSPAQLVSAVCRAAEDMSRQSGSRSIFSDVAVAALRDCLSSALPERTPSLFGVTGEEVRKACASYATTKEFGLLARRYFASFLGRSVQYFVSKEIHNHVGPDKRFADVFEAGAFEEALEVCAHERAEIIETFAGGWASKEDFEGGISLDDVSRFMPVALKKLAAELSLVQSE